MDIFDTGGCAVPLNPLLLLRHCVIYSYVLSYHILTIIDYGNIFLYE